MSNFKPCVIIKSILIALLSCIVFTVVGRLVIAGIIAGTSMDTTTKPFVYLLILSAVYAVCIIVSVIVAQGLAAGKGVADTPDNPLIFYLILMAIFAVISVAVSFVCIRFNTDIFMEKLDITILLNEYSMRYPELSGADIVDKLAGDIRSGVVKGAVIGNIAQAVLTFASVPICLKRHNNLF